MTFGGPAGAWELPKIIGIEAEYFEPNRERMRYPVFRAQSSALPQMLRNVLGRSRIGGLIIHLNVARPAISIAH
jgi:hypothetical protein